MRDISVKEWPGLDEKTSTKLQKAYVYSVKTFLDICCDKEGRDGLRAAGLTGARIRELRKEARAIIAALPEVKIHGILEGYFETGTEGIVWSVYEDGKQGYEGLHCLEKGDRLRITDEKGVVHFDGVIKPNYKKGWRRHLPNQKHGQPCALGLWIHWTQEGWKPDDWAKLFMRPQLREGAGPALRAELTVNPKKK